uniref:TP53-regulated inhibitor of apoptosis 1 n=1 Tax=Cacopsylla melanoneura TaxID=428564 RepID=A0A8D8Y7F6_9HEMI
MRNPFGGTPKSEDDSKNSKPEFGDKMNSVSKECTQLKHSYDECFQMWFTERFLKGDTDDSMCSSLLKVYQTCVHKAMREHQIDFSEVLKEHLHSADECKPPS